MKKRVFLAALAVLLLAPALLMAYPAVGDLAPNFTIPDTAWVNHSLSDYRGKVVQILFWSSG
jgi:peroxiredoxin